MFNYYMDDKFNSFFVLRDWLGTDERPVSNAEFLEFWNSLEFSDKKECLLMRLS